MHFLDPDTVPTMGDWFRAAGYRTHYRGKWHVSHPDLTIPGTHESLRVNDADGVLDPAAVDAYRRADRLDPYGFSGWIGREPHGADKADTGFVRDGVFAQEVVDLFGQIAASDDDAPWLAVASFVNPHDIAFTGAAWQMLGFPRDRRLDPRRSPRRRRSPTRSRAAPTASGSSRRCGRRSLYPQDTDLEYRRLYHFLQVLVDAAIMRILDELARTRARRRHHRRVHLRPRRHARRARRDAAEVAQRLRRGDARAAARVGSRHRHDAPGVRDRDQPRRPRARRCSGSSAPTSRRRRPRWRATTSRRSRSWAATCRRSSPDRSPTTRSTRPCTS